MPDGAGGGGPDLPVDRAAGDVGRLSRAAGHGGPHEAAQRRHDPGVERVRAASRSRRAGDQRGRGPGAGLDEPGGQRHVQRADPDAGAADRGGGDLAVPGRVADRAGAGVDPELPAWRRSRSRPRRWPGRGRSAASTGRRRRCRRRARSRRRTAAGRPGRPRPAGWRSSGRRRCSAALHGIRLVASKPLCSSAAVEMMVNAWPGWYRPGQRVDQGHAAPVLGRDGQDLPGAGLDGDDGGRAGPGRDARGRRRAARGC